MTSTKSLREYDDALEPARVALGASPAVAIVLAPSVRPELLQLFLMYFSALGVKMTESVPDWITRAGRRCTALGMESLGRALEAHARGEADHHLLMIADLKHLAARWNESNGARPVSPDKLLALDATAGVRRYCALHEGTIAGDAPYQQVAIEYEIERLSVDLGPRLIGHCAHVLGPAALAGLSFVRDHAEFDVAHTRFNRTVLTDLLAANPQAFDPLVAAGREALAAYGSFLADCLELAESAAS